MGVSGQQAIWTTQTALRNSLSVSFLYDFMSVFCHLHYVKTCIASLVLSFLLNCMPFSHIRGNTFKS